ncbi:MAG: ABC transporter substrate-binding protein [Pirellula sp.]|jgi:NitT/TauT family transport system substrate-binding protein|nr:ABC transporter substrate-binding protein [Pirellula sp.]
MRPNSSNPAFSLSSFWLKLFSLVIVPVLTVPGCEPARPAGGGKKQASQSLNPDQAAKAKELLGGANSAKPTKIKLILNWYPEAEHGGFYAAQAAGIYAKYGLDVEIVPGGKSTLVPQELVLGRVEFGVGNADDVLIARNQEIDLVALMAPIQDGPRCILTRKDSNIDSFEKLRDVKLQIDSSRPYVSFLKSKGLIGDNVEVVPYFGSVAQVVADKNFACQGYNFSEPFMARQQGVDVNELMLSTIGYNPYASLLITTSKYVKSNEDVCKRMVQASIEGWQRYLESPEDANKIILSQNKQGLEKAALDYGVTALKSLCIPASKDASIIGDMTPARWEDLHKTLSELQIIDPNKVPINDVYTLKFLSK